MNRLCGLTSEPILTVMVMTRHVSPCRFRKRTGPGRCCLGPNIFFVVEGFPLHNVEVMWSTHRTLGNSKHMRFYHTFKKETKTAAKFYRQVGTLRQHQRTHTHIYTVVPASTPPAPTPTPNNSNSNSNPTTTHAPTIHDRESKCKQKNSQPTGSSRP